MKRCDIILEQCYLGSEWCALGTGVVINIDKRMK